MPRTEAEWQALNKLVFERNAGYDSRTGRIIQPSEMEEIIAAENAAQSKTDPCIFTPIFRVLAELRDFQKTRTKVICTFTDAPVVPLQIRFLNQLN